MTLQIADRVWDVTGTTGTGAVLLLVQPPTAYQSFGAVCSNNDTIYYCIASRNHNEWEVGLGTYGSAGPTLTRTTVYASSNGGSAVNFSSGTKDVMGVWPATKLGTLAPIVSGVRSASSSTVTLTAVSDYFLALDPTSNTITVNLPPSPVTGQSFLIKDATGQAATHNITLTATSTSVNIDGANTYVISDNWGSVAVTHTGTQWSLN